MIDIKLVREHPELIKANIKKKFQDAKLALVDEIQKKDIHWRKLKAEVDQLRAERNTLSRQVSEAKKAGKDAALLLKKAKTIPEKIAQAEQHMQLLQDELQNKLKQIPNIMHSSVPVGKDASHNKEIKKIGAAKKPGFEIKNHAELAERRGLADFGASARTSGAGFYYLKNELALLNQALIRFAIEKMVQAGFTYIETPLVLREAVMSNVADLHDMQNQIYKLQDQDLYLIGTSEHSLIGQYLDTIIPEKELPIKLTSYSMCFRKEIGSHGIDEKGLFRTHQFNKIEMIAICKPQDSMKHFEELKNITISICKEVGIPIRVLVICSGDLGDLKHIQVDIEAWSPRKQEYYEIGSCSNLTDAQARRLKMRVDPGNKEKYVPHTLNNTAMATSRVLLAILENYQQRDGSVKIPTVLQKYMFGKKVIGKETKKKSK